MKFNFGDGNVTTSGINARYIYDAAGIYEISAEIEGGATVTSLLLVQEPIEGLQIMGPSAVEIGRYFLIIIIIYIVPKSILNM